MRTLIEGTPVKREFTVTLEFPSTVNWPEIDCQNDLQFALDEFFEGSEFEIVAKVSRKEATG